MAANAQTPAKKAAPGQSTPGQSPAQKPTASGYRIKYDHKALRIPGNKFAIGLIVPPDGKKAADTIGYPGKDGGWGKYHVEVDSGSFSGRRVPVATAAMADLEIMGRMGEMGVMGGRVALAEKAGGAEAGRLREETVIRGWMGAVAEMGCREDRGRCSFCR
jgi:hypothetical protein